MSDAYRNLYLASDPRAHPCFGKMLTLLRGLAVEGRSLGVPVLGADLAAARMEQARFNWVPEPGLREVWHAVERWRAGEIGYEYVVEALTAFQFAEERRVGIRR